jgi:5-methylcytosine-specific restriction endonuclease McrA
MAQPRRDSNGTAWRKARARVLAEETNCAACGITIDSDAHWLDPRAPQVDHIIPFSKGGHPTERANLQLLCRRCNRAKSNGSTTRKSDTSKSFTTSRSW